MIRVESVDQEGRGIAHVGGKVIFIEGALPGETVTYTSFHDKATFEIARVETIIEPSAARVVPRCRHFGICGGCSLQHLDISAQVAVKQRVLEDNLWHIGKVRPDAILPAIYGQPWGYRHRARFSARFVSKKGGALIGFREKRSSRVAEMTGCEVVPHRISLLLAPLRELIGALSIRERVPQLELAIGEGVDVLVLRALQPPTPEDANLLRQFADQYHVQFFLQLHGPESVTPFYPLQNEVLHYRLPEFALKIDFSPTDFTQVNHAVNAILVRRALALLDPLPGERIADMFCGLGNFSLAIARQGSRVVGIEGNQRLVASARSNAENNGLVALADFMKADLFQIDSQKLSRLGKFDRMLLDPPRDGAIELIKALENENAPSRIVYVSCNPATLARDAGVLVHTKDYRLSATGVVNMFPHTSHVESVALFRRD
jgi:23S rRNA (uracil1939-C5)-methyltransferase